MLSQLLGAIKMARSKSGKIITNEIKKRMTSLGMITPNNTLWVDNEDMWLYA